MFLLIIPSFIGAVNPSSFQSLEERRQFLTQTYGFSEEDFIYLPLWLVEFLAEIKLVEEFDGAVDDFIAHREDGAIAARLAVIIDAGIVAKNENSHVLMHFSSGLHSALTSKTINEESRERLAKWLGLAQWLKDNHRDGLFIVDAKPLEQNESLFAKQKVDAASPTDLLGASLVFDGLGARRLPGEIDRASLARDGGGTAFVSDKRGLSETGRLYPPITPRRQGLSPDVVLTAEGSEKDKKRLNQVFELYKKTKTGQDRLEGIRRCAGEGDEVFVKLANLKGWMGEAFTGEIRIDRSLGRHKGVMLGTLAHEMKHHYNRACFPEVKYTKENELEARLEGAKMAREYQKKKPSFFGKAISLILTSVFAGLMGVLPFLVGDFIVAALGIGGVVGTGLVISSGLAPLALSPFEWVTRRNPFYQELELFYAQGIDKNGKQINRQHFYKDLPTVRGLLFAYATEQKIACGEPQRSRDPWQCRYRTEALDELQRWIKEDIAYKKRIGRELGFSKKTVEDFIDPEMAAKK